MATAVDNIQAVLKEISILWSKYRPNRHCRAEITEKAQQTLNFCRCYLGVAISTTAAFALSPIQ